MNPRSIYLAAEEGELEALRDLIAAGIDVNAPTNYDQRAMVAAATEGHVEAVAILFDAGAELNLADCSGTPLSQAVENGNTEPSGSRESTNACSSFNDRPVYCNTLFTAARYVSSSAKRTGIFVNCPSFSM